MFLSNTKNSRWLIKTIIVFTTFSVCFSVFPALAEVKINIEGLEGELKQNVDARLATALADKQLTSGPRVKFLIRNEIRKGLRAKGYYQPTITFNEDDEDGADNIVLTIQVDPGKPVVNEEISIQLSGDSQQDDDYLSLLENFKAYEGKVLDHGIYESAKKQLLNIALRKGYFDSDIVLSQLGVSEELLKAYWKIDFDSGKRYRFGYVTFHGSQIKESFLRHIVPFDEDDEFYTSGKLSELNQNLSSTNWYQSVSVIPQITQAGDDKILPIDVYLSPRKQNNIEVGAGYSTSVGPRAKISWNKPWINSLGHSAQSFLSVSAPEQKMSFSYKIPLSKQPLVHYYVIQSSLERIDNNDTKSDAFTLSAMRNWDYAKSWRRFIGLTINYDDFEQGLDRYATFLFYPTVGISRVRSDGALMPMWGDYQQYTVSYSNKAWFSGVNFWSVQGLNTWIRSVNDHNRFVLRGSFGYLSTHKFEEIPPSLRFFAGGDRSVRGYGYQSISPRNDKGKLTGGTRMATGSLEYQYNLSGSWWSALFVDTGTVSHTFKDVKWKTGVGAGIRWASPVGPIKLDVAVPLADGKKGVHFYIGLGSEL